MLDEIAAEVRVCKQCRLWERRTHAVPGEGRADARIMFVGEGPGYQEDQQGRPFCGPAGQFLDELLGEAGLRREEVFITNVVKCRPPGNRDPMPDEIAACRDYLNGQIAVINPRVICTLGRPALQALIDPAASIMRERGKARIVSGVLFVPLLHPAAALHRQDYRPLLIEDMRKLRTILQEHL